MFEFPTNKISASTVFQKADLAIADLTITYEREQAVDFSMPFMNLGIRLEAWEKILQGKQLPKILFDREHNIIWL